MRRGAARGVRHRPGRGRGDERGAAGADAGRAERSCCVATTCDPDRIAALAAQVAPRGLTLIETPVSGSSGQVRNGDGVGLIGGDKDAIDGVADIIDALYPKWFYMGAAGNGGRAKLAINHMLGLNRLVLAEGLVFAQALGLDPGGIPRRGAAVGRLFPGDGHQGPENGERRLHAAGLHPPVAEGFSPDPRTGRQARAGDCRSRRSTPRCSRPASRAAKASATTPR